MSEEERTDPLVSPLQVRSAVYAARLLAAVVVAHGIFAVAAYERLPARIPVHFDSSGAPNGFASPGLGSWFFLVLLSAGVAFAIGLLAISIFRIPPRWVNLPQKEAFLALPEPDRRPVLAVVAAFTLLLAATICASLFAIQVVQTLVAFGTLAEFPVFLPVAAVLAVLAEIVVMTVRTSAAIDAARIRRTKKER